MSKNVKIKDTDKGAKRIRTLLSKARLSKARIRVGVFSDQSRANGELTNADVATFHEFGTSTIPERSFIRSTLDNRRAEFVRFGKALAARALDGHITLDVALEAMGLKVSSAMRDTIRARIDPPLADETLRRKGEKKFVPLVDTGALLNSITYKVQA
jgi:hypothetical protein